MSTISENVREVQENIANAASKAGRKPEDITLIGVTKTIDTDRIQELLSLGVRDLGENRVQELLEKYPVLGDQPIWHLIGHLQTNKVKYIMDKVTLIHSVDSIRLAQEINSRAAAIGKTMDILVELNLAQEESKFGIFESDLDYFLEEICCLNHIVVKGFMMVAPFVDESEKNREYFQKLTKLFVDRKAKFRHNMNMEYLSMGMTNDYEIAIEEGANMVRVGTGIFGRRNYKRVWDN